MSYFKNWGSGFDFQDLGEAVGLKGIKPMKHHWESSVGLHGFNEAGKAHGANALGGLLVLGGSQAAGAMGGGAASGGAAGGSGGLFSGLFGGGSGAAGTSAGEGLTLGGGAPDFSSAATAGDSGGFLDKISSFGKPAIDGLKVGNEFASMGQQQPMQQPQMQQRQAPDLSGFIAAEAQRNAMMDAERQKRLQQQQMALGGLFGGANGRIA